MSVVLATGGYDHKIRFWEATSGICTRMIKFSDSQINRIEITPFKEFIAVAGNPVVRLYEIQSNNKDNRNHQEPVLTLEGHTNNVTSLGFQKDGRYLYTSSEDNTIKVWDLRSSNYSHSWDVQSAVNCVTLRTDKDEFITGDQNGYVKIWNLRYGTKCMTSIKPSAISTNKHDDPFFDNNSLDDDDDDTTSSSNSSSSQSSPNNGTNRNKGKVKQQTNRKKNQYYNYSSSDFTVPIQSVDVSEDSRTLVAVSNHGTVFVWDPSSSNHHHHHNVNNPPDQIEIESHLRPVTKFHVDTEKPGTYILHAKIAPNNLHLVTTGSDGTARLYDTTTWEMTKKLTVNNTNNNTSSSSSKWVWDAAFCADSSYLVTASSDHVARLWNLRTGDVVRQYHGHQSAVTCVALNDSSG